MIRREQSIHNRSRRYLWIPSPQRVYSKWMIVACIIAAYVWYYHGWMNYMESAFSSEGGLVAPLAQNGATVMAAGGTGSAQTTSNAMNQVNTTTTKEQASTTDTPPTTLKATARFPNGTLGYIADPTALRKGMAAFLSNESPHQYFDQHNITTLLSSHPHLYWKLLQEYHVMYRNGTFSGKELLSSDYICALGPGRGFEQDYGYRILSEKVKVYNPNDNDDGSDTTNTSSKPRILCLVYTYPKMRDLQRTQALTWGYQCDGYLAFSTETIPSLGLVDLDHEGEESYQNMWQKVRSIWTYVYQYYANDYDFFHLGGDDLYLVVSNLSKFLSNYIQYHDNTRPIHLGQWIPLPGNKNDYYVSGGPGYTLNREALIRLVQDALPSCRAHVGASYEDRLVSHCLRTINITGGDTRDAVTGEQVYHDCDPAHVYTFRSTTSSRGSFHAKTAAYWETLPHPNSSNNATAVVGPKHELEAAGTYSITFHDIYHPIFMARLHCILYRGVCPETTALGRALSFDQCKV